jgi:hypothetical protein
LRVALEAKTMKLSDIKVDSRLAEQGDWIDNIPEMLGIRLKVRGAHNMDYRVLEAKLTREVPRSARIDGLSPSDQDRIVGTLLLETVLIDVQGLQDEVGEPLPYSRELGQKLLLDADFRSFRDAVAWAADVVAKRRAVSEETEVKNLSTS